MLYFKLYPFTLLRQCYQSSNNLPQSAQTLDFVFKSCMHCYQVDYIPPIHHDKAPVTGHSHIHRSTRDFDKYGHLVCREIHLDYSTSAFSGPWMIFAHLKTTQCHFSMMDVIDVFSDVL